MGMMDTAYKRYADHINNGFEGFKDNLVSSGQGAGVYGHILMSAGAYLADRPVMSMAAIVSDSVQLSLGRPQAKEEVEGDFKGVGVGKHMWNYLSGNGDKDELKKSITNDLCK